MISPQYVQMMARYNKWQNNSLYGAAQTLDDDARDLDRGAFFGSIRKTLSHLRWGDSIWMSRFTSAVERPHNAGPFSQFDDWHSLCEARATLDEAILHWAGNVDQDTLDGDLTWHSGILGRDLTKPLAFCITGFFNHQTHHRGQVHAMLTAAGAKPDDTDLFLMPESV